MESQGKYDYAILGEGLASWVSALLLSRQGDRVVIIPEQKTGHEFSGRILFGLEENGILRRMLERWGISRTIFETKSHARMECLTPETSFWIQGSLSERGLGAPRFELEGTPYEKILNVVAAMENQTEWKSLFESDFIHRVRRTTGRRMQWVPFLSDTATNWKRVVRKAIRPRIRGIRLVRGGAPSTESAGRLLRGLGYFLSREDSWKDRAPEPIQIVSDLFALRNAYFSDEMFEKLKIEFRRILRASGVEFLDEEVRPHFKRDSSGTWEGLYESKEKTKEMNLFYFKQLILTRSVDSEMLNRFEATSRKGIELDISSEEFDRYELEVRFPKNPFPFHEPAELVSRSPSGGWVRFSVYPEPRPHLRVGAWVPVGGVETKGDPKIVAERRLLREIRESLPGLEIESKDVEISTEIHRERRFKRGLGVRGKAPRVWHAHHQSYPRMGEYGPVLAAIEIARRRARKKKRELPL